MNYVSKMEKKAIPEKSLYFDTVLLFKLTKTYTSGTECKLFCDVTTNIFSLSVIDWATIDSGYILTKLIPYSALYRGT